MGNTAGIKAYIAKQLKADRETDQLSLFEPRDPFTGSKEICMWLAGRSKYPLVDG